MVCFSLEFILEVFDYCFKESEMVERCKIWIKNVYLDVKLGY